MTQTLEEIRDFKGKYPKQIWSLFFSEMWERFCFYGMRGMLTYFMITELLMKEDIANLQYGATQAFVYAFTFIGGLFADKILGFRKSLFWGGIMMIIGSAILATDPHKYFFLGIAFTIIGTGFFKPNISTMVGELYHPDDPRRDAGFSLFYAGINLGALLGGYLCIAIGKGELFAGFIPEAMRWNVAFGLAAIVMIISLINFVFTQKTLGSIGIQPKLMAVDGQEQPMAKWKEYAVYGGTLVLIPLIMKMVSVPEYTDYFMWTIGPLTLIYFFYEMTKVTPQQRKKLWVKLAAKKLNPRTPVKFALSMFVGAFAFFIMTQASNQAAGGNLVSPMWLVVVYVLLTIGELMLSPIGLSMVTKLSPGKITSIMMGVWMASFALGNYLAATLEQILQTYNFELYPFITYLMLASGVALLLLSPILNKFMKGIH